MPTIWSWVWKSALLVLGLCAIYAVCVLLGAMIPVNAKFRSLPADVAGHDIYVRSNGVHTDILLPAVSSVRDWRGTIAPSDLHNEAGDLPYVSFGWGDKGFYLDTPTWADLKVSTALVAAFGLGSTAMHVEAVAQPVVGEMVRHVRVSDAQLAALVAHIDASFAYDVAQHVQKINTTANYNEHDAFYEAHGRYSLFSTCNEWTRDGLSAAQIRTALFSPAPAGVLRHLPLD
ncbi:MAG: TIGR02117 family protein [Formosimonas sp.]